MYRVHGVVYPANKKHLYNICTTTDQRLGRWSNIVQMLYKCFVFAGLRPWANIKTTLVQCIVMAGVVYIPAIL